MIEQRPLTRRQLAHIQVARGVPAEEIQQRTGMPRASYAVLFGPTGSEQESDKEFGKLVSKTTFDRLIAHLGIDEELRGLRPSGVLEWRAEGTAKKTATRWIEAVEAILKEVLSEKLTLSEITLRKPRGLRRRFSKTEAMVLVYDRTKGIRIAITHAPLDLLETFEKLTGLTCQRRVSLSQREFNDTREMIRHESLRSVQFDSLSGVVAPTYSWNDVQAAAREFGFHTDDLVNMMHETAERRSQGLQAQLKVPEDAEEERGMAHNSDFQIKHLRVVSK